MSEAMNEPTGMMAETPENALSLARVAFLAEGTDGIVSMYHGLDDSMPVEAYAARRRLKAIDANSPERIVELEKALAALEEEHETGAALGDLRERLKQADAAWQAAESQRVRICQMLDVDYTCEEPETCEQVIARWKKDRGKMEARIVGLKSKCQEEYHRGYETGAVIGCRGAGRDQT